MKVDLVLGVFGYLTLVNILEDNGCCSEESFGISGLEPI